MYEKYQKKLESLLETKLEKTKKVDLALNEDIKKNVDKINFNIAGLNDILKIIKSDLPKLRKIIDNGKNRSADNMKLMLKTEQLVNKYVKAAKDLGISGGMIDALVNSFEKAKKQSEDIRKEIQSISDI